MRLLFLTDRLSDRGGADQHLAQVVADAVDLGYRVTVGYGRDEGGMALPVGVESRRVRGLASRTASAARLGGLGALLNETDLVHVQNVMNPIALARATSRGRTVVTIQDHRFFCPGRGKSLPDGSLCAAVMDDGVCRACLADDGYRRSTLELTGQRLDALGSAQVVVLSQYMAAELEAVRSGGARVIPPWVEAGPARRETGSAVVMGGRLVAHKGILDGWRAWNLARRPLPLLVPGAGSLESGLEGAELLGWLTPSQLKPVLRRARLLLFPAAWQEPFGILGLEALAQGTPVVVAATGGTAEWSADGCIRVPPGDVAAMAEAVVALAADPGAAMTLGHSGRIAVGDRFARHRIVSGLRELYRSVVAS